MPTWHCWIEDTEAPEDATAVEGYGAEDAAQAYAARTAAYDIARGARVVVAVRAADGTVTRCLVTGEYVTPHSVRVAAPLCAACGKPEHEHQWQLVALDPARPHVATGRSMCPTWKGELSDRPEYTPAGAGDGAAS